MTVVPAPSTWAGALFDLDGTLADTVELILKCYRHTMKVHIGKELPDERWLATIGTPLRDQLRAFAADDDEAARMLETYATFQRTVHDEMVDLFPGVGEVLATLREAGVPIAVVTSKRKEMALRTLRRCGLGDSYDVLVTADDVERGKPDPEPVRLALRTLGIPAEAHRSVFVGDSPFDLRAGRAAGTRTAAALWGPYDRPALEAEQPDYYLEGMRDLLKVSP